MGQTAEQFLQVIGIRRRERDRRETEARLAHEAYETAEAELERARHAVDTACRTCENAQRARAASPCDTLVADYVHAEHERLELCRQEAASRAEMLAAAQRAVSAARFERQRAQVRLDVLETEHAAIRGRERRRSERKREEAQPLLSALASPC
ncbi:hypothetical protein ABVV53_10025 [Novosphingobium sp. RD2P27]|uniref:Uncharacterized protein n=1 Tax=Novosphingobium kalidii TaxID=3230299 RepID=A0ABV2D1P3_9SPHN